MTTELSYNNYSKAWNFQHSLVLFSVKKDCADSAVDYQVSWADNNNNGYVDGYVYNGQYYPGTPTGYDPNTHSVLASAATGALGGAALGAAAGAVIPGVSVLQGAVIGAAVGGLAGAVWADRNNDGVVDGYMYNGQYYPGAPAGYSAAPAPAPAPMPAPRPTRSGERG